MRAARVLLDDGPGTVLGPASWSPTYSLVRLDSGVLTCRSTALLLTMPSTTDRSRAMPTYSLTIPGDEFPTLVEADDASLAKSTVREERGLKRLPNGVVARMLDDSEVEALVAAEIAQREAEAAYQADDAAKAEEPAASKPARASKPRKVPEWKALPDAEKAAYLLSHQTLADRLWTDQQRLPKESRAAFIARVLLGQVAA